MDSTGPVDIISRNVPEFATVSRVVTRSGHLGPRWLRLESLAAAQIYRLGSLLKTVWVT